MVGKLNKSLVHESLWAEGDKPPKSTGRSNCTVFLDHPELLLSYELKGIELPDGIEVPAYRRRIIKVKL